jgi:type IV pilus assembly protein PilO
MALSMDSIYKLPTSRKALILVVLLCVIVGLYVYAFFMPWQTEMKGLKVELNNLARELNESKAIAKDLQKFKDQVAKLNIELANALTQLPNEKEIPEILRNISTLGKESNLEFTLFRPKPEEPKQFYANVPIELVVLGSYHNTGMFFDRVSKLPRIINVVNFSMASAKDVKGRGEAQILVKTSCLVNTYRFLEKKGEEQKGEEKKSEKGTVPKEESDEFPRSKKK